MMRMKINVAAAAYRSKLIAARLRMDAVQQSTSNAIHVSQRTSPRPQRALFTCAYSTESVNVKTWRKKLKAS